jgi:hypothetical protein
MLIHNEAGRDLPNIRGLFTKSRDNPGSAVFQSSKEEEN